MINLLIEQSCATESTLCWRNEQVLLLLLLLHCVWVYVCLCGCVYTMIA